MANAAGTEYSSFPCLEDAQAAADGAVILEGDDGGQVYAALPASIVRCSELALEELLRDLDHIAWPGNILFAAVPGLQGSAAGMERRLFWALETSMGSISRGIDRWF